MKFLVPAVSDCFGSDTIHTALRRSLQIGQLLSTQHCSDYSELPLPDMAKQSNQLELLENSE